jgi:hypothetical protein
LTPQQLQAAQEDLQREFQQLEALLVVQESTGSESRSSSRSSRSSSSGGHSSSSSSRLQAGFTRLWSQQHGRESATYSPGDSCSVSPGGPSRSHVKAAAASQSPPHSPLGSPTAAAAARLADPDRNLGRSSSGLTRSDSLVPGMIVRLRRSVSGRSSTWQQQQQQQQQQPQQQQPPHHQGGRRDLLGTSGEQQSTEISSKHQHQAEQRSTAAVPLGLGTEAVCAGNKAQNGDSVCSRQHIGNIGSGGARRGDGTISVAAAAAAVKTDHRGSPAVSTAMGHGDRDGLGELAR